LEEAAEVHRAIAELERSVGRRLIVKQLTDETGVQTSRVEPDPAVEEVMQ
jgi:hypothetical protein